MAAASLLLQQSSSTWVTCFSAPVSAAQHYSCSGSAASLHGSCQLRLRCSAAVLMLAVGNSTSVYTNVTFLCMQSPHGQSPGGATTYGTAMGARSTAACLP